ncbi:hypothetical protein B296_00035039 [Ensete ventricosum]|uniref:EF-hand domain-containing protein n=1 Tax=Ensete ventricosum TaxID=4639 RepID=A0A426YIM0_ENSVE|nr:hypothetical protein B296_00035039 [Ensete ventricosum]
MIITCRLLLKIFLGNRKSLMFWRFSKRSKTGTVLLEQMDSNTDGLIDFGEFVAAALHMHQLVELDSVKWQSLSQAAFDKFDVDRDGYITPEELRMHTGLKGSIDPLLEEVDIDKDGKISLDEFRRLLKTASMGSRNVPNRSTGH